MKRYTVKEAAQVLGVGTDAVRKRIQRDTIDHEHVDGTVYVWLDDVEPRHDIGVTENLMEAYKDQLEAYKDQVGFLRRELERKDTIIMTMAQRIPELEPAKEYGPEPQESSVTATDVPDNGAVPQEDEPRSWLRRFFGL